MRRFNVMLIIFSLLLTTTGCSNTNNMSSMWEGIESRGFGELIDTSTGMIVSDHDTLIVLEYCEIDNSVFTLPTEFTTGLRMNYVGDHSFNKCDEIVELTIPDGYEYIGQFAFLECANLERVHLGKDVFYIGDLAFTGCPEILEFTVSSENPYLYEKDGCVIERTTQRLIATNGKIPDETRIIGACIFGGNKNLTNVIIPYGVEKIEGYAFDRSSVKTVELPETLSYMGKLAFANCLELTEIFIPAGVNVIEEGILGGTDGVVINCEAESQPQGWSEDWLNGCTNYQLNWGVERENT